MATQKTVLVTGGAVRIGAEICRTFAKAGWQVAIHCRNSVEQARKLVAELGNCASVFHADLTDSEERDELIPAVMARLDGLDALINNASVYHRRPLAECDDTTLADDFTINFIAPFQLMRQFHIHARRGVIINLLDCRVEWVDPGAGTYALAKKSLRDATEAAALEWAPDIRVNAVAPGLVLPPPGVDPEKMKPLIKNIPIKKPSPPEEVAKACRFLVETETITGQIIHVDGGLHLPTPHAN
jgi:pteridine reductase